MGLDDDEVEGEGHRGRSHHQGDGDNSEVEEHSLIKQPSIEECLDHVRKLVSEFMATKCHSCRSDITTNLSVKQWLMDWLDNARDAHSSRRGEENPTFISAAACPSCAKQTCLGCGEEPKLDRSCSVDMEDYDLNYCCRRGRMFGIWVLLARYDLTELDSQSDSAGPSERPPSYGGEMGRSRRSRSGSMSGITSRFGSMSLSKNQRRKTDDAKGVGYADEGGSNPFASLFNGGGDPRGGLSRPVYFKVADRETDFVTEVIMEMMAQLVPSNRNVDLPPGMSGMLQLSLIIDKAAELLRNDSLDDIMKRRGVYMAVFAFVEKLGRHPEFISLVQDSRRLKRKTAGLQAISQEHRSGSATSRLEMSDEEVAPVADRLKNLFKQSQLVYRASKENGGFRDREGKSMLNLCKRILDLYKEISRKKPEKKLHQLPVKERWVEYHKESCLERDDDIIGPRSSYAFMRRAREMISSNPGRMKRLVTESANMATSLPLGIFVKVCESRPDVMKALIMGPPDSPYGYGLFE